MFRQSHKSALFGQKWKMIVPGIVINNPKIIELCSFMEVLIRVDSGIVDYNPGTHIVHL